MISVVDGRVGTAGLMNCPVCVGMMGLPNAGKSTLINALAGKRVVSVSKTPGHTKHLQTIFLNERTRLCDCPGLVFPRVVSDVFVSLPLQVSDQWCYIMRFNDLSVMA